MTDERTFKEPGVQEPGEKGDFRYVAIKDVNLVDTDEWGAASMAAGFEVNLTRETVQNLLEAQERLRGMVEDGLADSYATSLIIGRGVFMEPLVAKQAAEYNQTIADEVEDEDDPISDWVEGYDQPGHCSFSSARARITPEEIEFLVETEYDASIVFKTHPVDPAYLKEYLENAPDIEASGMRL